MLTRQPLTLLLGVGLVVAGSACTSAPRDYEAIADSALEGLGLDGLDATYDAGEGVVRIAGSVTEESDRALAGETVELAIDAVGDATVVNDIVVDDLDAQIRSQLENLEHLVEADAAVRARSVEFSVEDAVVTIAGRVPTEADKARVEMLVREVVDVRDVMNGLEVDDNLSLELEDDGS